TPRLKRRLSCAVSKINFAFVMQTSGAARARSDELEHSDEISHVRMPHVHRISMNEANWRK
ncbi:MAG: hypothetical protein MHMPM18_004993, partial [Marteilia pararefringens]